MQCRHDLRAVSLYGVVDVDEDEEDGDKECHPPRDDLRVHQETVRVSCEGLSTKKNNKKKN